MKYLISLDSKSIQDKCYYYSVRMYFTPEDRQHDIDNKSLEKVAHMVTDKIPFEDVEGADISAIKDLAVTKGQALYQSEELQQKVIELEKAKALPEINEPENVYLSAMTKVSD